MYKVCRILIIRRIHASSSSEDFMPPYMYNCDSGLLIRRIHQWWGLSINPYAPPLAQILLLRHGTLAHELLLAELLLAPR